MSKMKNEKNELKNNSTFNNKNNSISDLEGVNENISFESLCLKYVKDFFKFSQKPDNNDKIINKINENIIIINKLLLNSCAILYGNLILFKKDSGNFENPDKIGNIINANLLRHTPHAHIRSKQQSLSILNLTTDGILYRRHIEGFTEKPTQMRFCHTSHVRKFIKRKLIADMLLYVHTNLEHTLIGIVGYFLSMLHKIRGDNPYESL